MAQLFQISAGVPEEQLLQLLLETLGLEFRASTNAWTAKSYGGSLFQLARESHDDYSLRVSHDKTHPRFADQQRAFCAVDEMSSWIPKALTRDGIRCVFKGTT